MKILIRNVKKEDIPKVVDIQIRGWKTDIGGKLYTEVGFTYHLNK